MTGQQLKNSILQLAIQGKLVPQNPADESASELLQRIREEKEKLVKEKKIKKEKPLPEISEDEKPFDIPEGWVWVRWGDLSYSIQYGYNAPAKEIGRIRMVRISDIQNNKVMWETVPFCDICEKEIDTYTLRKNDILFARTGGTVGKSFLVDEVPYESVYAGYLIRTRYNNELSPKYLKFFMESKLYWEQLKNGTIATAQPNCNGQTLSKMVLPLPPLQEQHRIVEKIEELMPLVDEYDKAQKELNTLNANLPEALKKSILQEAIQGKLGTNNPDDEPASELLKRIRAEKEKLIKEKKIKKEKPLPEISDDEKPFEIPDNWVWCRLGEICEFLSRGRSPKYADEIRKYPVFAQKCNLKNGGISLEQARFLDPATICKWNDIYKLRDGDVLVNSTGTGTVGRTRLFNSECLGSYPFVVPDSHVSVVRTFGCICSAYIYNCLISDNIQKYFEENLAGSTNQKELYIGTLGNTLIPLPPLQEQHRIVEKLNNILPKLKKL